MRLLFFLAALGVVGLVVTGAIKLTSSGNQISIQIDKQRVRQEVSEVIDEGREVLHEAKEAFDDDSPQQR